jgi:hypothetical protein
VGAFGHEHDILGRKVTATFVVDQTTAGSCKQLRTTFLLHHLITYSTSPFLSYAPFSIKPFTMPLKVVNWNGLYSKWLEKRVFAERRINAHYE